MSDDRYDDLWLWPMPEWFVKLCNRTIGARVLDVMLYGTVLGIVCMIAGYILEYDWLRITGYVLIAPVPLLVVMMIITVQYRQWKQRL